MSRRRSRVFGGFSGDLGVAAWGVLLAGFALAAALDVRTREAPDPIWLVLGIAGVALGTVALWGSGAIAVGSWLAVGLLILQHFVGWDLPLERVRDWLPGYVELAGYLAVGAGLGALAAVHGIGTGGVPAAALAAYVAVVAARGLFEYGLLYGGADAKALIAAAALVPLAAPTLLGGPAGAAPLAAIVPGPITLLMNAAVLSISVPIAIGLRNLRAREFEGLESLVGYRIPVAELPDRFVWLKDPVFGAGKAEEAPETSEEDRALRERQKAQLEAQGVQRVWVTPQLPYLVFFFAGALAAALVGNLLFDLLALV